MSDSALLGVFLTNHGAFEKYHDMLPKHLLEPETITMMEDMGAWYDKHPDSISPANTQDFWEWLKMTRHPNIAQHKLEAKKQIIKAAITAAGTSTANDILQSLVLRDHAGKIAQHADAFASGNHHINLYEDLYDMIEDAQKEAGIHTNHSHEAEWDIDKIMDKVMCHKGGIHWRSPNLEAALGPIRQGNFVMIAGFVDSGKTTALCSEVTFMASQLPPGKKVLYFNNEEEAGKVQSKLIQAATGWTLQQIDANRQSAIATMNKNIGPDRIVLVDNAKAPITPGLIRRKLRQYDAGLVVFDQLYKVRGFKIYGEDKLGQLRDIFEFGRQLAKQYCPVIAVHQARGDANGLEKIEMHQLAGSQQAMQGELDAIVTIGRNLNMPNIRYLYVPKNKMPTPGNNALRNGFFEIEPDFEHGIFDK